MLFFRCDVKSALLLLNSAEINMTLLRSDLLKGRITNKELCTKSLELVILNADWILMLSSAEHYGAFLSHVHLVLKHFSL